MDEISSTSLISSEQAQTAPIFHEPGTMEVIVSSKEGTPSKRQLPVNPKLPAEVLLRILSNLEIKTLLVCRLVCERWTILASLICHDRHLCISNGLKRGQNQDTVFSVNIVNYDYAPFSSCVYFLRPNSTSFTNLFPYVGSGLRQLTTIGHYDDPKAIINLLLETPNLEKLRLSLPPYDNVTKHVHQHPAFDKFVLKLVSRNQWYVEDATLKQEEKKGLISKMVKTFKFYFATPEIKSLSLPHLTTLHISITGWKSIQLLELLTTESEAKLRSIYLKYYSSASAGEYVGTVARLISNIPKIVLEIRYVKMTKSVISGFAGINLTGLVLNVLYADSYEPHYYQPLEDFLVRVGHHLQFLTLRPYRTTSMEETPRIRFSIPPLLNLKSITFAEEPDFIGELGTQSSTTISFGFQFLIPFKTNHFPTLNKIVLKNAENLNAFLASADHFDSVQELVLKDDDSGIPNLKHAEWKRLLPNLNSLDTTVDAMNLEYIFCNMQKLEHLSLTLGSLVLAKENEVIDDLFVGKRSASRVATTCSQEYLERYVAETRIPSLHSLSRLKTLKLNFLRRSSDDYQEFDNSGVILSILVMRRLDLLSLGNAKVSAECEAKLRLCHNRVENKILPSSK